MDDADAYLLYPQYRKWFNKLWLSESLGYYCGPAGIAPEVSDYYIVRPIMNLSGMSVGAYRLYIEKGDYTKVPPGSFWCSWFDGFQHSVTYQYTDSMWQPILSYLAERDLDDLSRFRKWIKTDWAVNLPKIFDELKEVNLINVEFVDGNIIEVHLRNTLDPIYNEMIPIWVDNTEKIDLLQKMDYSYIENQDNADGFLKIPRIGFMVK